MTIARRPIASIAQVDGLQGALDGKAALTKALRGRHTLPVQDHAFDFYTPMAVPPVVTLSAANAASSITGSVRVFPGAANNPYRNTEGASNSPHFRYIGNIMGSGGTNFPDYNTVIGTLNTGQYVDGGMYGVEFIYEGTEFEYVTKGGGQYYWLFIDGQIVSVTPLQTAVNGSTYRVLVQFASRGSRRIAVYSSGAKFFGVDREPTGTVCRPPAPSVKSVWQGDSFTSGTPYSFWRMAAALLGIDDAAHAGQGATGYLQTGGSSGATTLSEGIEASSTQMTVASLAQFTAAYPYNVFIGGETITVTGLVDGTTVSITRGTNTSTPEAHASGASVLESPARPIFRARTPTDIERYDPDIVVFAGGLNDYGSHTASAIGAESLKCFEDAASRMPDATLIVIAPFWVNGAETFVNTLLQARDAIKASAEAVGALWVDLLELPLVSAGGTTTLSANASSGATSISVADPVAVGATIDIGDYNGTWGGRRVVTNRSGSGPYTLTLNSGISGAQTSGLTITEVGPCLWTGTGQDGSPAGNGNSDLLVSSDGTHPTPYGHAVIGAAIARQVIDSMTRL